MPKIRPKTLDDNYLLLIGRVIKKAIEHEGPEWLESSCAKFWCEMGFADTSGIKRMAKKYDEEEGFLPEADKRSIVFDGCYETEDRHNYLDMDEDVDEHFPRYPL